MLCFLGFFLCGFFCVCAVVGLCLLVFFFFFFPFAMEVSCLCGNDRTRIPFSLSAHLIGSSFYCVLCYYIVKCNLCCLAEK